MLNFILGYLLLIAALAFLNFMAEVWLMWRLNRRRGHGWLRRERPKLTYRIDPARARWNLIALMGMVASCVVAGEMEEENPDRWETRVFSLMEHHEGNEQHFSWGLGGRRYFTPHLGLGASAHWFDTMNDTSLDNVQLEAVGRWSKWIRVPAGVGYTFEDQNPYAYAGGEFHYGWTFVGAAYQFEEQEGHKLILSTGFSYGF